MLPELPDARMETRKPMEIPPGKCRRAKSAAPRYTSETGKMMAEGENRVNAQREKTLDVKGRARG